MADKALSQGCGSIHDGIRDKVLVHIGEPVMRAALDGATTGDAWRWTRKSSTVDITTLVAATCGWVVHATPEEVVREHSADVFVSLDDY